MILPLSFCLNPMISFVCPHVKFLGIFPFPLQIPCIPPPPLRFLWGPRNELELDPTASYFKLEDIFLFCKYSFKE